MTWDAVDWPALDRLRELFLKSEPVQETYWRSESDLASYDFTFAQRIAWKWDAALQELGRLNWVPPPGDLLDWGCGSGVASRCLIDAFGADRLTEVRLHDRSPLAMNFAKRRALQRFPSINAQIDPTGTAISTTLVVSHVLNELHRDDLPRLLDAINAAQCVLWLEPGIFAVSRGLVSLREQLRKTFYVVAPCPHRKPCGLLPAEKERDWCHFFAKAPSDAFTNSSWVRFGQRMGIDLRSLPYSWLVLDRRPVAEWTPDRGRVLGLAELFKPYARAEICRQESTGLMEIQKRTHGEIYRQLKQVPPPPEINLTGVLKSI